MRLIDSPGTSTPTIDAPSTPAPRPSRGLWPVVAIALMALTSLAVASVGLWLLAPYWALMAWILLVPSGRPESVARADGLASREAGSPSVPETPTPASAPEPEPEPEPAPAPVPAPKAKRSRGKGKSRARVVEPPPAPATVTWVRVGPGKFVRVEEAGPPPAPIEPPPSEPAPLPDEPAALTIEPTPVEAPAWPPLPAPEPPLPGIEEPPFPFLAPNEPEPAPETDDAPGAIPSPDAVLVDATTSLEEDAPSPVPPPESAPEAPLTPAPDPEWQGAEAEEWPVLPEQELGCAGGESDDSPPEVAPDEPAHEVAEPSFGDEATVPDPASSDHEPPASEGPPEDRSTEASEDGVREGEAPAEPLPMVGSTEVAPSSDLPAPEPCAPEVEDEQLEEAPAEPLEDADLADAGAAPAPSTPSSVLPTAPPGDLFRLAIPGERSPWSAGIRTPPRRTVRVASATRRRQSRRKRSERARRRVRTYVSRAPPRGADRSRDAAARRPSTGHGREPCSIREDREPSPREGRRP